MVCLTICFSACKKARVELPSICPPEDFLITEALKVNGGTTLNDLDFTKESINITASFNHMGNWTLTIKGKSSGVVKTFHGKSKDVNVEWRGEPGTNFFQIEEISISLSVECYGEQDLLNGNIIKTSDWAEFVGGVILSDFDHDNHIGKAQKPPGVKMVQSKGVTSGGLKSSPAGGNYFNFIGKSDNPEWYFGGTNISGLDLSSLPSNNPEEVYLNVYLHTNGTKGSTAFQLTTPDGIKTKTHKTRQNNEWNLVSIKFSEFGVKNPKEVTQVDFLLNSLEDVPLTSAEINFDFMVITTGGPLFE